MEFTIEKRVLLDELNIVCPITEKKTTLPALACVQLRVEGDCLDLFATNLDVGITTLVRGIQVITPGIVCVQAKKLLEIVRSVSDCLIRFKLSQQLSAEGVENISLVVMAGAGRFRLLGINPDGFPVPRLCPDVMVSISGQTWHGFVQHCVHAISTAESKFALNGAQLEYGGELLRLVATDGHRLALLEQSGAFGDDKVVALLPKSALVESGKLADGADWVSLALAHNHLFFRVKDRLMFVRLLAGHFPDYKLILPDVSPDREAVVDRKQVLAVLKRVSLMVHEKDPHVNVVIAPGLWQVMGFAELGDGQDAVEINYTGEEYRVGFNPKYLVDVFSLIDTETVKIALREKVNAGMVEFSPIGESRWKEMHLVAPQNWS